MQWRYGKNYLHAARNGHPSWTKTVDSLARRTTSEATAALGVPQHVCSTTSTAATTGEWRKIESNASYAAATATVRSTPKEQRWSQASSPQPSSPSCTIPAQANTTPSVGAKQPSLVWRVFSAVWNFSFPPAWQCTGQISQHFHQKHTTPMLYLVIDLSLNLENPISVMLVIYIYIYIYSVVHWICVYTL